jgi:tryptophan-rich sensory protein
MCQLYSKKSECWQEVTGRRKMPQMITRVSESPKNAGIIIQGTQRLIIVLQLAVVHLSNASPTFSNIFLPFILWHYPFSNFVTFTIVGCSLY